MSARHAVPTLSIALLLSVSTASVPDRLGAQLMIPTTESARIRAPAAADAGTRATDPGVRESTPLWRPVAFTAGGAMLGGWIGYFASQVSVSDWRDDAGTHRTRWAATGAIIGAVSALAMERIWGDHWFNQPTVGPPPPRPSQGPIITQEQIRQTKSATLYDALQILAPQWLNERGKDTVECRGPAEVAGACVSNDGIVVYVNGGRAGDLTALRDIAAYLVTSVERLGPGEATYRFGRGHTDGAILVSTE